MPAKPPVYIDWCPDADPAKIVQPSSALAHAGYIAGQAPAAQHFNWVLYTLDQWIQWLEAQTELTIADGTFIGIRPSSLRLIGGGTWTWNATTGVLAWSAAWQLSIPGIPPAANNVPAGSVTLADGQSAFVDINPPYTTTGDTTSGSPVISNIANVTGLEVGMTAYANSAIPAGATIVSISGSSVTLSANATGTSSGLDIAFSITSNLTKFVLTDQNFVVPGNPKVVFARRIGSVVHVGAPGTTMVLQDTQQLGLGLDTSTYTAVAGETLTAGQFIYISPGAADGGRTTGRVYRTDASASNGATRAHVAGVVMTGGAAGASVLIAASGMVYVGSSLVTGTPYYLDPATLGGITATAPSGSQQYLAKVGVAMSSTSMLLGLSRPQQQAALVTRTYFTHFANAMLTTDTSTVSMVPVLFSGNASGYVRVNMTAGAAAALLPIKLPGSGTITAGSFDVSNESGSPTHTVGIVRMDNNDVCTTLISGVLGGGPFVGPTTVGTGPNTYARYTMGTLSEAISSGYSYFAYVQWNPPANAVARWIGFRFDVITSEPYTTAG